MNCVYKLRLAKRLAGLIIGISVVASVAFADDLGLSLPQSADAAIILTAQDGIAAHPSDVLQVFIGTREECCDGKTPIAGHYVSEDNQISFTPAFGFSAGQDYVARIQSAEKREFIAFRLADNDLAANGMAIRAAITEVYPSADTLPENILRFYLHFSVPMQPGVAFDYIKLRDASGRSDDAAFMRFKQELWNEDRTRLTLLIDPGRIKRGVATNMELGPALVAGNEYTLDVDAGWPSADGETVLPGFSKSFTVTQALRELPDVSRWRITQPCLGTQEPLQIALDRPFDRHLLSKSIRVISSDGTEMPGRVLIANAEHSWSLVPEHPWPNDTVEIHVSAELEDVAANNFRDLLDHRKNQNAILTPAPTIPLHLPNCQ